jgi:hypothetical protein
LRAEEGGARGRRRRRRRRRRRAAGGDRGLLYRPDGGLFGTRGAREAEEKRARVTYT